MSNKGRKKTPLSSDAPLYAHKMRDLLSYFGLSDQKLGDIMGLDSGGPVRAWANGDRELGLWAKKIIAHELDVPESWWDQEGIPIEAVIGKGLGKDEGTEDEGIPIVKTSLVPMIEGALRAGEHGYEFTVEDLTLHYAEQVPVPIEHIKKAGPHCLIRVEGDSMEPMYYDGDVVLVNLRQQNLETLVGKPVAAWVPDLGGGLIKILKGCYRQDQWILHSVNNRRPDIPVAKDQPHFRVFEIEALVYQPRKVAA